MWLYVALGSDMQFYIFNIATIFFKGCVNKCGQIYNEKVQHINWLTNLGTLDRTSAVFSALGYAGVDYMSWVIILFFIFLSSDAGN